MTFISSFLLNGSFWDVFVTLLFGLLGFLMIRVRMSRVPLLLGLVLGPLAESNLLRSLAIGQGNIGVFFESPISIILIILVVITIATEVVDFQQLLPRRGEG
jgi:putative tricarboxylic transport membrane protein